MLKLWNVEASGLKDLWLGVDLDVEVFPLSHVVQGLHQLFEALHLFLRPLADF